MSTKPIFYGKLCKIYTINLSVLCFHLNQLISKITLLWSKTSMTHSNFLNISSRRKVVSKDLWEIQLWLKFKRKLDRNNWMLQMLPSGKIISFSGYPSTTKDISQPKVWIVKIYWSRRKLKVLLKLPLSSCLCTTISKITKKVQILFPP